MSKAELNDRLHSLQLSSQGQGSDEMQAVLHELEVYQIELEMQLRELKESRQELEASHDRYVDLYDFAPVGYITLSDQGLINEINLTAAGMLGVERGWLMKRSLSPWITGSDLPLFRNMLKVCRQSGGSAKLTLHLVNRAKQVVPVELSASCSKDATGALLIRTAVTDLSERKAAEEDLDRFFKLSTDLICILEGNGHFKRVNPASEHLLGYSPAEMTGYSFRDFLHPEDRDRTFATHLRNAHEGASLTDFQNRFIRKDGQAIWLSWNTICSGGMFYAVARDITAQVQAKLEIESYVTKLKEERKLRERFVAALTHDLRTPMTVARVSAELMGRQPDNPALVLKLSDRVLKSVDRTDRMIQDLLDANRIQAGEELPLRLSEFDLVDLIRSTLEELSVIYGKKLTFQAPASLHGSWSRHDLRRVIENLITNAVKYGDPDRPVTVSLKQEKSRRAILSVRNFGNPIAKAEQATLFSQFRRTGDAQKSGQKGWGIGLTLVRGIVEAHGGEIEVESSASAGTTFRIVLPLKRGAA